MWGIHRRTGCVDRALRSGEFSVVQRCCCAALQVHQSSCALQRQMASVLAVEDGAGGTVKAQFAAVKFVEQLQYERGLRLVRYKGGDDFRTSESLLHYCQTCLPNCAVNPGCVEKIVGKVRAACESVGKDGVASLPTFETVGWDACEWDFAVHVSSQIRGIANSGEGRTLRRESRANLFHHGWLYEKAASERVYGKIAYPLIGVVSCSGDGLLCYDPGDGDALGEDPSAPFDGTLRPADQHIHKVDSLAGGSLEEYIRLLMETGLSHEDATVFAEVEMSTADEYYMGADMARLQLNTSSSTTCTSAVVVCVDLQMSSKPRVLVTYLVVVTDKVLQDAVKRLRDEDLCSKSVDFSILETKLTSLLPSLRTKSTTTEHAIPLDIFKSHFLKIT